MFALYLHISKTLNCPIGLFTRESSSSQGSKLRRWRATDGVCNHQRGIQPQGKQPQGEKVYGEFDHLAFTWACHMVTKVIQTGTATTTPSTSQSVLVCRPLSFQPPTTTPQVSYTGCMLKLFRFAYVNSISQVFVLLLDLST